MNTTNILIFMCICPGWCKDMRNMLFDKYENLRTMILSIKVNTNLCGIFSRKKIYFCICKKKKISENHINKSSYEITILSIKESTNLCGT